MLKAIIFDFDGVLVLSEESRFQALKNSANKYGIVIDDSQFSELVGKTTKSFLHGVLSEVQKKYIPSILEEQKVSYKNNIEIHVKPVDITVKFIKDYNGPLIFAIASMSDKNIIGKILNQFNINSKFTKIISKENVVYHKPHPQIYLKALNELKLTAENCIAVEDTVIGVQSANAAGLRCYVVLSGFNNKNHFKGCDVQGFITSTKDLEAIISRFPD